MGLVRVYSGNRRIKLHSLVIHPCAHPRTATAPPFSPADRLGFGAGGDGGGQRVGGQGREASLAAGEEGEQGGRVGEGASGERLTCGGVGTKAQVARSPPSRLRVCLFHIPLQRKQTPRLLWIK
jgi:hypothetical protein